MELAHVAAVVALASAPAFVAFGLDKQRARADARRISERALLLLAWLGPPGAWLGAWVFRHKTRKLAFLAPLVLVTLASPLVLWAAWSLGLRPTWR